MAASLSFCKVISDEVYVYDRCVGNRSGGHCAFRGFNRIGGWLAAAMGCSHVHMWMMMSGKHAKQSQNKPGKDIQKQPEACGLVIAQERTNNEYNNRPHHNKKIRNNTLYALFDKNIIPKHPLCNFRVAHCMLTLITSLIDSKQTKTQLIHVFTDISSTYFLAQLNNTGGTKIKIYCPRSE